VTLRQFFERYGPTAAVVAVLALLIAVLPSNAPKGTNLGAGAVGGNSSNNNAAAGGDNGASGGSAGGSGFSGGSGSSGGGGLSAGGTSGGNGGVASGGGSGPTSVAIGRGPNCRQDLREKGISAYQPPCVQFSGSNGGATYRGVLPDKIVVVNYLLPVDPGTQAILQGANLSDSPQTLARSYEALRRYYNNHFETYGREVVLHPYTASGQPTDDEAMKADAVKIANEIKAFAVIEGNPAQPIPRVLAEELAARGVVCICTVSFRSGWYQERPPYVWSSLPTITEYSATVAEYIGKRLKDKPAKWAGNLPAGIQSQKRKFGLIYLEGQMGKVDPEGKKGADEIGRAHV